MKTVHTRDTMSSIYLDSIALRQEVFVQEQGIPMTIEIDRHEAECIHCLLYTDTHQAVATCRLLPLSTTQLKLQRMAVKKSFRTQGYGQYLVDKAELFAKEQGYESMYLGAQVQALGFYETLGYTITGEPFTEAGIIHYPMRKKL